MTTDALDVLDPAGETVAFQGDRVEVRPLTIGQLPRFVRTARPVIDTVLKLGEGAEESLVETVVDLLASDGEALYEAVAVATGLPAERVAEAQLDEFLTLAQAVVRVNRDFFVRRLAPLLARARVEAGSGAGPTPSSSSSSAATA